MDIVGLARVRSDGGKWYVLLIVDGFSRYSWVFFMESKDEVFFTCLGFDSSVAK